jgi:hypothetical protein
MRTVAPKRAAKINFTEMFEPPAEEDWLLGAMDEAIAGDQPLWNERKGYYRVSSAGLDCARAIGFRGLGHGTVFEARVLRIFRMGNAVEAGVLKDLQGAMRLKKVLVRATQARVTIATPPFRGALDVTIMKTADGDEIVGEIKSMNKNRFDKLPKPAARSGDNIGALLKQPHLRENLCQIMVYMDGGNWTNGFLLYECKDDSRRRIFWFTRDQQLLDEIYAVHSQADLSVQKGLLPPVPMERRPGNPSDRTCKFCSAQYLCVVLPPGEVTYENMRQKDREIRGAG